MITPAQRAEIRRLYYGEHWKLGTIAAQLGLHHETVRAAVERETGGFRRGACRPSILDPHLPFIRDTLAQYPSLRATRIYEMVRPRGYAGSVVQLRRLVQRLRPETSHAVYRRVVTLPGESAQVDWGSFGKVRIGQGTRTVSGFVMVLGYSRALAALFTLDQTLESFLRGHVHAFDALGGIARNLVYDNLRSAVLDRRGRRGAVHPRLLELAGHYHFAPRPCTPGRGKQVDKLLAAFQAFFREHSEHWVERFRYKEAGPQLLLQAFLQRIVNSGGRIEREYGLGRMRTDLLIVWPMEGDSRAAQRVVIECKVLRRSPDETLREGLRQTRAYMDRCAAAEGHLVMFDRVEGKAWDEKVYRREEAAGATPVTVWGM